MKNEWKRNPLGSVNKNNGYTVFPWSQAEQTQSCKDATAVFTARIGRTS